MGAFRFRTERYSLRCVGATLIVSKIVRAGYTGGVSGVWSWSWCRGSSAALAGSPTTGGAPSPISGVISQGSGDLTRGFIMAELPEDRSSDKAGGLGVAE
jgi:hypothetical protein